MTVKNFTVVKVNIFLLKPEIINFYNKFYKSWAMVGQVLKAKNSTI